MQPTTIALNRFGLGARLDASSPTDPKQWLLAQLERFNPQPGNRLKAAVALC